MENNTKVITCPQCGKSFEVPVGLPGRPRTFCQNCAADRQRERERRWWTRQTIKNLLQEAG